VGCTFFSGFTVGTAPLTRLLIFFFYFFLLCFYYLVSLALNPVMMYFNRI
jgi:hypothetical protein